MLGVTSLSVLHAPKSSSMFYVGYTLQFFEMVGTDVFLDLISSDEQRECISVSTSSVFGPTYSAQYAIVAPDVS